jgi:hypothetical protein
VRRLEDNTLCIARHTSHADLRVDPLAFLRCGPLGNLLAIVFAPLYRRLLRSMPKKRNLEVSLLF